MTPDQFLLFAGTLPEPLFLLSGEGEILEANAAAHRLLGAAARKLCGIRIHDLVQEDADKLDQHLRLWARSREMLPAPLRLCAADGSVVECHCGGALVQPRTDDRPALLLLRCQQKKTLTLSFVALNEQIERLRKEITVRKRTEERLQTLARVSPVGIFHTDAEGNCNYTNERWRELAGLTEAEALGEGWARALHPEDRERVFTEWYQAAADNIPFKTECRFQRPDGKVTWLWTLAEAELDAGGQVVGYVGAITDITERKRTEETVRNIAAGVSAQTGEAFFQSLVTHLAKLFDAEYTFIGLLDEQRPDMVDTVALCVHGEVVDNLSYELANTPCKHVVEGNCDELQAYPRDIQRLFPDDPMLEEMGAHSYVGAPLADTTGKPIGLIVVMDNKPMENTEQVETILRIFAVRAAAEMERLRAEEALRESQKMLQLVLDSIPVRVFWKDRDSIYLGCNQHFAKDAGLESPEQIIGRNDFELGWHEQAELYRLDDQQVMQSGLPKLNYEEPQTSPDETRLWLQTSKIPLKDLDGNVFGVLGVYEDITERKLAEERFVKAFQSSPLPIIISGMKDGLLLDVNDGFEIATGYSRDEIVGKTSLEIGLWRNITDRQRFIEILQKDGKVRNFETDFHNKAGESMTFEISAETIEHGGKPCLITVANDITERKHIEEAIRESEEKFRLISEQSMLGIVIVQDDVFKYVNQAISRMNGYDFATMMAWKPREWLSKIIHPGDLKQVVEQARKKQLGESNVTQNYTCRSLTKSGKTIWVEIFSGTIQYGGQPADLVTIVDITERKQAEESLQQSEAHLRTLIEALPDLVWLKDPDGVYLTCNPKFERFFGVKQSEIVGRTDYDFVDKALADFFREKDKTSMAAGKPTMNEEEVTYADDGHKELLETIKTPMFAPDGKLIGILGVGRDITERKRVEEVLQQKEARIRMVVESALDAIIVIDENSVIIEWNPQAEVMFGWKPVDAIGRTLMETIIPPQYHEAHQRGMATLLVTGEGPILNRHKELTALHREGREFPIELTVAPLRHGETWIFSAFIRDLTERKRAEDELEKHREHLEELVAERTIALETANEDLKSFSYSVSHDLRAPLRAIDGFSLAVLEDNVDRLGAESKDNLERVRRGAQRMSGLIDDMLQLSRVTRHEIRHEKVDLSRLATTVLTKLEESEPDRKVDQVIAREISVHGDSHLLELVLDNLLGNAWKYTSKTADPRIEFGVKQEDGEIVYFVKDNGAGFNMSYADKLFGAFQRLHKEKDYPGTGIGLATVQRIVHRHGGRVWAEAEVGKGAAFYFTIPKA
jgi:PAS domain S-box-containing protein